MATPPVFPLHIGDYLRDTLDLETVGHGAYLLLLLHCWTRGHVPDDDRRLAAIAKVSLKVWRATLAPQIRPLFTAEDGKLINKRVREERKRLDEKSEGCSAAARSRWERDKSSKSNEINGDPDANASPSQKPPQSEPICESDGFLTPSTEFHKSPPSEDSPEAAPKRAKRSARDVSPAEVQQAFDAWNAMARKCNVVPALVLSDTRRAGIARLLRAHGMDAWMATMERVRTATFCHGGGERGWRADIDWLFRPQAWQRLMEGFYERAEGRNPSNRTAWLHERKAARAQAAQAAASPDDRNGPVIEGQIEQELELTP